MKIVIEARALAAKGSGTRTYVRELLAALRRQTSHEIIQLTLPKQFKSEALILPWINWQVPRDLKQLKPAVVHFTKASVPARKQFPTVVTIYDIIPILFPESQKLLQRLYWPGALRQAVRLSDHILTISEASKRDIVSRLQVDPAKITVTPLAVDTSFFSPPARGGVPALGGGRGGSQDPQTRQFGGQGRLSRDDEPPYVLFVGTLEPRKNVPLLVRAFARIAKEIPHTLVIAGRRYKGSEKIEQEIAKANLEARVKLVDFVPYEELPSLYAGADLFVWPSVYEGWGLPPMEAMACGTPVLVSNGGSLPEVVGPSTGSHQFGGQAGQTGEVVEFTTDNLSQRMFDQGFEEQLANSILALLSDLNKRSQMSESGLQWVKQFSWDKVAEATLTVYEQVAAR